VALGIHYAILAELANQVWMFSGGSIDDRRFSLISVSVKRQQEVRLLTGQARYVADIDLPGMLEAVFVLHTDVSVIRLRAHVPEEQWGNPEPYFGGGSHVLFFPDR
jgi:hypothetical protein